MSYKSMLKTVSIAALIIGASAAVASAQVDNMFARDRVVGAGERYQPSYSPEPKRVGAFIVEPSANITVEQNSNVFARQDDEQSDVYANLAPELRIRSDWSRHEIAAEASANHREYADLTDESNTSGRARLRGRLDIGGALHIGANAGAERRIEARGETGAVAGVLEPGEVSTIDFGAYAQLLSDRVRVRLEANVAELDYKDLVVETEDFNFGEGQLTALDFFGVTPEDTFQISRINTDRDFRDNTRMNFVLDAAYAISPDIAVFVRGEQQIREHDTVPTIRNLLSINAPDIDDRISDDLDVFGLSRFELRLLSDVTDFEGQIEDGLADDFPADLRTLDNERVSGQIGVSFQLPQLLRGDIAIGYFSEEFDSDLYSDKDGLAYEADLQWLPTELTTVSLDVSRSTRELGSIVTPTAVVSELNLRVDHELKRNIVLFGFAGQREELFENTNLGNQGFIDGLIGAGQDLPNYADDFSNTYTNFGLGAEYRMNRHAHFEVGFERRSRDSDLRDQDFDQNLVRASIRLFP